LDEVPLQNLHPNIIDGDGTIKFINSKSILKGWAFPETDRQSWPTFPLLYCLFSEKVRHWTNKRKCRSDTTF